ncbi:MAG: thiolase family protein [Aeromicrobium sp.]|nr:thiolase family protein [Aeromicrobium sp.]
MTSVLIAGVGVTDFTRSSGRSEARLAVEAAGRALEDCGLSRDSIDGIVSYPTGPRAEELIGTLDLRAVGFTATSRLGGASSVAGLQVAMAAIMSGAATVVLCYFARNGSSRSRIHDRISTLLPAPHLREGIERPHGLSTPAQLYALLCQRHMYEHGTTREQLGQVAVTMRSHAQLNPGAQLYGRPLAMDDYLASPAVSLPYLRADCCLETDGSCAVIVVSDEVAARLDREPVVLAAVAEGHPPSPDDLVSRNPFLETGLRHAASAAFDTAGLRPADVDVAMIYDCFTFEVIHQLEEAGFCGLGDGGPFVESGAIALGGALPVNPHGGLMAEGHLGGMNHVVEAVRQLRDEAGGRQVDSAQVAAVTGWGDLGDGAMALLVRHG